MALKRVAFHTFGCKVNQWDTQALREQLTARGVQEVPPEEGADLHVVNTCSVTHVADKKARQLVRRLHRHSPQSRIVMTGCYASRDADALRAIVGVDYVISNENKEQLVDLVLGEELERRRAPGYGAAFRISGFEGRTRAFIKVQDGCEVYCTFCIIPFVRGPFRSRDPEEVVAEAARLVEAGYREIVLTGICLGQYGKERTGYSLASLVRRVAAVPGLWRLRLSSIEAHELTDEMFAALAEVPQLCPHFHIPLQSGSDYVLKWMNRKYRMADFLRQVDRLREVVPEPALSTDVIVGFPREDDADFEETVRVIRQLAPMKLHIFPYSAREGTAAYRWPERVPPPKIKERARRLAALEKELGLAHREALIGREVEVLVEEEPDRRGWLQGFTRRYVRAHFPGPTTLMGQRIRMRVHRASPTAIEGLPVTAAATRADGAE